MSESRQDWESRHHAAHTDFLEEAWALKQEVDHLRAALREIAKGEGPFSTDQLEFACNVVERAKRLAQDALDGKEVTDG